MRKKSGNRIYTADVECYPLKDGGVGTINRRGKKNLSWKDRSGFIGGWALQSAQLASIRSHRGTEKLCVRQWG